MDTILVPVKDSQYLLNENNSIQSRLFFTNTVSHHLFQINQLGKLSSHVFSKFSLRGNKLTLKLKEIYFHDDLDVKAEDIEFSILRPLLVQHDNSAQHAVLDILGTSIEMKGNQFQSGMVKGIRIIDDKNLEITLKYKNTFFIESLCAVDFFVSSARLFEGDYVNFKEFPQGSGDFWHWIKESDRHTFQREVILEKSVNEVVFVSDKDNSQKEELDLMQDTPIDIDKYEKKTLNQGSISSLFLLFNFNGILGKDERFRGIIYNLIFKNNFLKTCLSDELEPLDEVLVSKYPGCLNNGEKSKNCAELEKEQDEKSLSEELILVSYHEEHKEILALLKSHLKSYGINIKLIILSHGESVPEKWDMKLECISQETLSPLLVFQDILKRSQVESEALKGLEELIFNAKSCDKKDRAQKIKLISQYFLDNKVAVPLFSIKNQWYIRKQSELKLENTGSSFLNINLLHAKTKPPKVNAYRELFEQMARENTGRGRQKRKKVFTYGDSK